MLNRIARLAGIMFICLALVGCAAPSGSDAGSIVGTAKDNASVVTCRTNRVQLAQQYSVALSGATDDPPSFSTFIKELGVKCPSAGVYSWDAGTTKVLCSVHVD